MLFRSRMVVQTDWDNDEAVAYLQHRFARLGLDATLAEAGCAEGDEVRILGFAFTYEGADDAGECKGKCSDAVQPTAVGAHACTGLDSEGTLRHGGEHNADG